MSGVNFNDTTNKLEVAIFYDDMGKKYLKRYVMGQCGESCETIKTLLND